MSINMGTFVPSGTVKPLAWLGKNKWLKFERSQDRWLISTEKKLYNTLSIAEKEKYTGDHWKAVHNLLFMPYENDKEQLFTYAMSRSIAFGPKMFKPTAIQCKAFENTSVDIPFDQYA